MNEKTFLLGVGAQKCGTTWLHYQLSKTPYFNPGFSKEYHVFDLLYLSELRCMKNNMIKKLKTALDAGQFAVNGKSNPNYSLKLSFYDSVDNYFNYFDYLYLINQGGSMVGDFTPSYSMLSTEVMVMIKQSLEKRGFKVKVIFGMRDPFDRIYSQLRMSVRNKSRNAQSVRDKILSYDTLILGYYQRKGVELRTRYDLTIQALESAFPKDDIFYFFYETLFQSEQCKRLGSFLGITDFEPSFDEIRNRSPYPDLNINENTILEVKSYYSNVYEFIQNKFGKAACKAWITTGTAL